ncbi:hypothetical protein BT69DRAFT_891666 [Atractiella rhizophila]|nr:hypothetical protein BT69DRAFT_891666 [Atractiella rhizophila]
MKQPYPVTSFHSYLTTQSAYLCTLPPTAGPSSLTLDHLRTFYCLTSPASNDRSETANQNEDEDEDMDLMILDEPARRGCVYRWSAEEMEREKEREDKKKKKGKGKEKANQCPGVSLNSGRCEDDPRCLNWLGQEEWEATGSFSTSLLS